MRTIAGTVLAISQVALGDVLAADATAGDTSITVDDAADFAEGGGTILIGGQLNDYTSVDDATGVMALVDALSNDATAGDRVDLADPDGSPAIEWQALVQAAGTVDADDAIQATISYALIPLLPEGIRDPGTGESVTLTLDGSEWQVTNVHGQQPSILPDNVGSTGSPVVVGDTTGQTDAVAISRTIGTGPDSIASGTEAVAIGLGSEASGFKSVAIGSAALASGANAIAIGDHASATAADTVAIGNGVTAATADDLMLGSSSANVQITGALILSDSLGGRWRVVVSTGGALSTVAYP